MMRSQKPDRRGGYTFSEGESPDNMEAYDLYRQAREKIINA